MKCRDIMRRVKFVGPDETVRHAARLMFRADVGFLPVCDDAGNVWGVLTDRDIALRACGEGRSDDTLVKDVMTREVIACRPRDSMERAEALMAEHQKSRILVTDESAKLLGVISLSDVARHEKPRKAGYTLRRIAEREAR